MDEPEAFAAETLRQFATHGFEATIRGWISALQKAGHGVDEFTRLRARQILAAAREFDETGERDIDQFLSHLRQYAVRSAEGAKSVIPLLTIHKAKGLDWDMVILPCLKRNTLLARNEGDATVDVSRSDVGQVEWVFDLPGRDYLSVDPRLAQFDQDRREDGAYEALCLLYVAMTRAKRGLYLITTPAGKSTSLNYYRLLDEALGIGTPASVAIGEETFHAGWQRGDASWFETASVMEEPASEPALKPLVAGERGSGKRFQRVRPSQTSPVVVRGSYLFKVDERRGHQLGGEVHELFERIDWLSGDVDKSGMGILPMSDGPKQTHGQNARVAADTQTLATIGECTVSEWVRTVGGDLSEDAVQEVLRCVAAPALRPIFVKPAGAVFLWREKAFELFQDGRLISGQIDRVVVHLDYAGNPVSAEIVDFKTDAVSSLEEIDRAAARHLTQLTVYRSALASTLGLPVGSVTAQLVFTRLGVGCAV